MTRHRLHSAVARAGAIAFTGSTAVLAAVSPQEARESSRTPYFRGALEALAEFPSPERFRVSSKVAQGFVDGDSLWRVVYDPVRQRPAAFGIDGVKRLLEPVLAAVDRRTIRLTRRRVADTAAAYAELDVDGESPIRLVTRHFDLQLDPSGATPPRWLHPGAMQRWSFADALGLPLLRGRPRALFEGTRWQTLDTPAEPGMAARATADGAVFFLGWRAPSPRAHRASQVLPSLYGRCDATGGVLSYIGVDPAGDRFEAVRIAFVGGEYRVHWVTIEVERQPVRPHHLRPRVTLPVWVTLTGDHGATIRAAVDDPSRLPPHVRPWLVVGEGRDWTEAPSPDRARQLLELAQRRDPGAFAQLALSAYDEDRAVARMALNGLGLLGGEAALAVLRAFSRGVDPELAATARAASRSRPPGR